MKLVHRFVLKPLVGAVALAAASWSAQAAPAPVTTLGTGATFTEASTSGADLGSGVAFDGGTLNFTNAGAATYAGSITVGAAGGTINVETANVYFDPVSLSGPLSGSGELVVNADPANGYGMLEFTAAGATQSVGTLSAVQGLVNVGNGTSATTLAVGALNVGSNAQFTVVSNAVLQVAGPINVSAQSGFEVDGELDVASNNAIAAPVAFNGAATVAVGAGATLDLQQGFYGEGALRVAGSGVLLDTGTQGSSIGALSIDSGATLQIGNGAAAESIGVFGGPGFGPGPVGGVLDNGTLVWDHSDSVTPGWSITGTGALVQQGSGTLTLDLPNSYTGGTTVAGGTLAVAAGGSLGPGALTIAGGASANLADAAQPIASLSGAGTLDLAGTALQIGGGTPGVYTGAITGSGSLTSSGELTLDGAATLPGGVTVAGGMLTVGDAQHAAATLNGAVAVDAGATLRGHGTVVGNVVNAGAVSPGGSIGVLTVAGNYTQAPTGTLNIEVTPATTAGVGYDQLQVGGQASLAGALAVQVDSGNYVPGARYDLVHAAGGVSGRFASVAYSAAFSPYLTPTVSYAAGDVYLSLDPTALAFTSAAGVAADAWTVNQSLFDAMTDIEPDAGRRAWIHARGGSGVADARMRESVLTFGTELARRGDWSLGVALAAMQTRTESAQQSVDGDAEGAYGYGVYRRGRWQLRVAGGGGRLARHSGRDLGAGGGVASGSGGGWYAGATADASWRAALAQRGWIAPYAGAAWLHTRDDAYTESGAGMLDLQYAARSGDFGRVRAGVRTGLDAVAGDGTHFAPWFGLGAIGAIGARDAHQGVTLGLASQTLNAAAMPGVALQTEAGLRLTQGRGNWSLAIGFDGQYSERSHFNSVIARWRWLW